MCFVGCSPVAEINPADERNVVCRAIRSVDEDDLLVVRAEPADPLVEQHLAACAIDHVSDVHGLMLAEPRPVRMRAPHQRAHLSPALERLAQHGSELRSVPGQTLAGVAPPVEEPHLVPTPHPRKFLVQLGEIGDAMDQRGNGVSLGPAQAIAAPTVDLRRVVPALDAQEPASYRHQMRDPTTRTEHISKSQFSALAKSFDEDVEACRSDRSVK